MHHNRIKKFLSRQPWQQPAIEREPAPQGFALLTLTSLPPAIQHTAAQQANLYRWAYEQALGRRLD